jgi:hypothetical protein
MASASKPLISVFGKGLDYNHVVPNTEIRKAWAVPGETTMAKLRVLTISILPRIIVGT